MTIFNDMEPNYTRRLTQEIESLPGIESLSTAPQVVTGLLDEDLIKQFEAVNTIPAVSFVDPWGYKGLSRRLIRAVLKDWGCDVVFFFNYNRINMGITNDRVTARMIDIFGEERLQALRGEVEGAGPRQREQTLRQFLVTSLEELGTFPVTFTFRRADRRVSHFVCFVSKHFRGYDIMKGIMARRGLIDHEGIPLYEYGRSLQLPLERRYTLARLRQGLLRRFGGRTAAVVEIYEEDSIGRPYLKKNYKDVLKVMEADDLVFCEPSAEDRRKNTIADDVRVTFPPA